MNTNTQIAIWIVLGAIILMLIGVFIGERRILSIVGDNRHKKHKRRHGRSRRQGYYSNYDDRDERSYSGYIVFIVALLVIGAVLFFNFFGGKLPVKLDKYLNSVSQNKETKEGMNLAQGTPSSFSLEQQGQDPVIVEIIEDEPKETVETYEEEMSNTDLYIVQAGVFSNWNNAKQEIERLEDSGLTIGYYIQKNGEGIEMYHIFTGTYDSFDSAEVIRQELGLPKGMTRPAAGLELQYHSQ